MPFVQIIKFRSSRYDEMRALEQEWDAAARDRGTVRRVLNCQDRNDPGQYLTLAFFDSYESAMENSNDPTTQELSQRMAALADGPPTFYDLDIVEDRKFD